MPKTRNEDESRAYHAQIAKELGYSPLVVKRLRETYSKEERFRILHEAREHKSMEEAKRAMDAYFNGGLNVN